jgi:methyl-accepting chemotaxis protein
MKALRFKLYLYRNRLAPMFVLLMVPWLAVATWAPWWVHAISIPLLFVSALLLVLHVLPTPPAAAPRRASDEARLSDTDISRLRKAPETDVQELISRWTSTSRDSRVQLEEVEQQVTDVMAHAESSVIEIGKRFIEVTRKTRQQVELAVALLSRTRSDDGGTAESKTPESLTDYINASDALLKHMSAQLIVLGEQLARLAARQEAVREDSKRIDGALDQLAGLASQIRVLALDSSTRGGTENRSFVEMTDRVRAFSLSADEASRAIRKILEDIKEHAGTTDTAIRGLAKQANDAGRQSNDQVAQLTGATLQKTHEVHRTLAEIGNLGERIQEDINQIVIALQFQDITQQKLQRLKAPMISELASSWLSVYEETRNFNRKLGRAGGHDTQPAHFRVSLKNSPSADKPKDEPDNKRPDNKVELF